MIDFIINNQDNLLLGSALLFDAAPVGWKSYMRKGFSLIVKFFDAIDTRKK